MWKKQNKKELENLIKIATIPCLAVSLKAHLPNITDKLEFVTLNQDLLNLALMNMKKTSYKKYYLNYHKREYIKKMKL